MPRTRSSTRPLAAFALTAALLLLPLLAPAATSWTASGPKTAYVLSVAVDPANPGRMFVLSSARAAAGPYDIYGSTDFGASWTRLYQATGVQVGVLRVAATDANVIMGIVNDYVLRSVDGGGHWTGVSKPGLSDLAIHPADPAVVFATGRRSASWTGAAFFRSADGGATWTEVALPHSGSGVYGFRVAAARSNPQVLYVLSRTSPSGPQSWRAARSNDGGATWRDVTAGIGAATEMRDLLVGTGNALKVYVATAKGVFRSATGGASWALGSGLASSRTIALSPSSPKALYSGDTGRVHRSLDGGVTWSLAGRPQGVPAALLVSAGRVYFAGSAGVFRSPDSGTTWAAANEGFRGGTIGAVSAAPSSPAVVYAAVADDGLYRSPDSGATWSRRPEAAWAARVIRLAVHPTLPNTVYALSGGGDPRATDGIYRTADGGWSWTRLVARQELADLDLNPAYPARVAACGFGTLGGDPPRDYGLVLFTRNGASTWASRNLYSSPAGLAAIAHGPGNVLYAGGGYHDEDGGEGYSFLRSPDGGYTWAAVSSLPARRIVVPRLQASRVYLLSQGYTKGIHLSDDGGSTWQPLGGDPGVDDLLDFRVRTGPPDRILAATRSYGVLTWTAGGAWADYSDGLDVLTTTCIEWIPSSGTAWVGTLGSGLHKRTIE